jgi:hypothetical protein
MSIRTRFFPGSVRKSRREQPQIAAACQNVMESLETRRLFSYSASLVGSAVTFTGNGAGGTIEFDSSGGLLRHNRFSSGDPGFNSDFDMNSGVAGDQTLAANTATTVNVNAGNNDDTLRLNGSFGTLNNLRESPTAANAGTVKDDTDNTIPTYNFTGVDHLHLSVQSADGDAIRVDGTPGNDEIDFFDSGIGNTGTFRGTMDQNNATGNGPFALVETTYTGGSPLSNDTDVNFFNSPGGTDSFVYNGTGNDDNITVSGGEAGGFEIRNILNGQTVSRVEVFNIASALVRGLEGNDTFNVNAPAGTAATSIRVEGGESDALTDTLNYAASSSAATTIDLATSTIASTAPAGNPVSYSGVERVNDTANGAASTLTVNGTAGDDTYHVTPAGIGAGSFTRQGVGGSPLFTYTGVGGGATFAGGAGGFDLLDVVGNASNNIVSASSSSVVMDGSNVAVGSGIERLDVTTLSGNDQIFLTAFTAISNSTHVDGGDGDDTIVGTPFDDHIDGGAGDDILVGGSGGDTVLGGDGNDQFGDPLVRDLAANDPGNDAFFGGAGSDLFFWDPGDGDDQVEGGAGDADQLFFSGNAGAEQFFLFGDVNNPARLRLFRVQAAIDIDAADLEEVNLSTLGGTDTVTVGRSDVGTGSVLSDLSTTGLKAFDVSLGADAAADNIIFESRSVGDNLGVSVSNSIVRVAGLSYDLRLDGADAAFDRLTVNGNEGNDTIAASAAATATLLMTLSGGEGNDHLSGDATLSGNNGNDLLEGGAGNNAMDGGAGDDTFVGNGGTDNVGGGAGSSVGDTILMAGTSGDDTLSASFNASGHLVATVNGLTTTYTDFLGNTIATSGVELIRVDAGDGDDAINIEPGSVPFQVNGGNPSASDSLTLSDDANGTAFANATNFFVIAQSRTEDAGVVRQFQDTAGAGNAPAQLADVAYTGVEVVTPLLSGVDPATGQVNLLVLRPDRYEQNESRSTATFIGAGAAINLLDLSISPFAGQIVNAPADQDWFRYVAAETGTLDFQAYFQAYSAELLPGGGDVDITVYDAAGNQIAVSSTAGSDDRAAIPVVRNETYFLRVTGAAGGLGWNGYGLTVLNTPAPTPFAVDLEAASDTGTSSSDNFTADNTPTFDIYLDAARLQEFANLGLVADVDYDVEVYNNGTLLGDATFVSGSMWQFTATAGQLQPGGSNFITAAVLMRDGASPQVTGRGAFSPALQVNLDTNLPKITITDASVTEGNSGTKTMTFTVKLSKTWPVNVKVNYTTQAQTATAGSDYLTKSGTLTFTPGQTSKTITISIKGDTTVEADETFLVKLSSPVQAVITDGTGVGTIKNDDPSPTSVLVSINDGGVTEGASGTRTVILSVKLSKASSKSVTVQYATQDGSAKVGSNDYVQQTGSITFAAGQTSKTITVTVKGDTSKELDEDFFVNLFNPTNSQIGDGQARIVIKNDD